MKLLEVECPIAGNATESDLRQ